MLLLFLHFVVRMLSGLSVMEIRNAWITVLIAITGVTILLSIVGIRLPLVQTFINGSLRVIGYVFKGIIRLIATVPTWISGLFKTIKRLLKSLGMSESNSNIVTVIIIIAII